MKPSEVAEASEHVSDILLALEGASGGPLQELEEGDSIPERREHIMEGSKRILELYGRAVDRPVRDEEGNIRFEYGMGFIYSNLDSYNGNWDFNNEEVEALHDAYRYLFLKSELGVQDIGYQPAEYSECETRRKHEEGLMKLLSGFSSNREYLAGKLEGTV